MWEIHGGEAPGAGGGIRYEVSFRLGGETDLCWLPQTQWYIIGVPYEYLPFTCTKDQCDCIYTLSLIHVKCWNGLTD